MKPKTIVWRIKFTITKEPGVANTCTYYKTGLGSGIAIDEFPEYYDIHLDTQIGDLIPYTGSIFIQDNASGKLMIDNTHFDLLAEHDIYSVFRWRNTEYPATTTIYDIVASDTNVLISLFNKTHTYYKFDTFLEFKDLMESDRTLKHLYGMIRAVEITPVDTLVAAATTDNRRKIVKRYIDKI